MIVRVWSLCLLLAACLRERARARARHDHVRDLGRAGRATEIPRRRQSAAQLPIRRSRRRVSRSQSPRPELRARVLGRSHEPQPPALGPTRSRGRASACSSRSHRRAQSASRKHACRRSAPCSRRSTSSITAPTTSSRATARTPSTWPSSTRAGPTITRSRLGTRCRCSARCGPAIPASAAKRSRPRSRAKCSPRIRATPARRTSSSTRSTTPSMHRSAWPQRAPTPTSPRPRRTRCTCRRTFSCSSGCGPTSSRRTSRRTTPPSRSTSGST